MLITPDNKLSLASASPRRKQLLENLGLTLQILKPEVDEARRPGEYGSELAGRLAFTKARAVLPVTENRFLLAADTVVVIDNEPLGKPENNEEAAAILTMLSNRSHLVITGCTIFDQEDNSFNAFSAATTVWFNKLTPSDIESYVATGSPLDKAGAYGIQDPHGSVFIRKIDGCYYNVMGLPVSSIVAEIRKKWNA